MTAHNWKNERKIVVSKIDNLRERFFKSNELLNSFRLILQWSIRALYRIRTIFGCIKSFLNTVENKNWTNYRRLPSQDYILFSEVVNSSHMGLRLVENELNVALLIDENLRYSFSQLLIYSNSSLYSKVYELSDSYWLKLNLLGLFV